MMNIESILGKLEDRAAAALRKKPTALDPGPSKEDRAAWKGYAEALSDIRDAIAGYHDDRSKKITDEEISEILEILKPIDTKED